jgi:hypothetical protein
MCADSGKGLLLRQSDTDVVFRPITCDARSASPPLQRRYIGHFVTFHPAYLVYRISLPIPAFRGVDSSPLRTAFSIGVAPSRTNVKPNNSALPLSVNTSVALAMCVLDTGFDGREREGGRRLGAVSPRGGVDGRGCVLCIFGGSIILVTGGGARTAAVVAFSLFTGAVSTALGRVGSIWRKGTTARCFRLGESEG